MADMRQVLRQWIVLRALAARRQGATVRELAGETGASKKSIRRDLQALARVGFRLDETTGRHGRKHWTLADGEDCPQLSFTFTEAASLYLGRRFLEPLAGTELWDGAHSAFLLLTVILFLGSRDALRKYYARTEQLLGGSREKSAVPANERGAWPGSTIDADISRETGWK